MVFHQCLPARLARHRLAVRGLNLAVPERVTIGLRTCPSGHAAASVAGRDHDALDAVFGAILSGRRPADSAYAGTQANAKKTIWRHAARHLAIGIDIRQECY